MKEYKQSIKEWRERNPEKVIAHRMVFINLRNGKIKKLPCFKCGSLKSEAHHSDYMKPLDIIWACKKHHIELDIKRKYPLINWD